jgi:hypothetical protein
MFPLLLVVGLRSPFPSPSLPTLSLSLSLSVVSSPSVSRVCTLLSPPPSPSPKAFDVLERLDPDPEYWEGKRGACVGVFQLVVAGMEAKEVLRDVLQV